MAKVEAAYQAGAKTVIIPHDNWQELFAQYKDLTIRAVDSIEEVLEMALGLKPHSETQDIPAASGDLLISPTVPLLQIKQD